MASVEDLERRVELLEEQVSPSSGKLDAIRGQEGAATWWMIPLTCGHRAQIPGPRLEERLDSALLHEMLGVRGPRQP